MTHYDREVLWELLRIGIPKSQLLALKDPRPTKAFGAAVDFCSSENSKWWLALIGAVGCGKSVAAAEVCRARLNETGFNNLATGQLPPIAWVPARDMTTLSAFNSDHETWRGQLERYSLLVVDDMGDEATEFGKTQLLGVLMARHAKNRRTVITSNLRPDAFVKRYGLPLFDRIRESAMLPDLGGEQSQRASEEQKKQERRSA